MAKYNAIYEGRLPLGIHKKAVSGKCDACHDRFTDRLIGSVIKIYNKYIDMFKRYSVK
jgi:hypothetical protein